MSDAVLILVDDSKSPFWVNVDAWTNTAGRHWRVVEVKSFGSDDSVKAVRSKVAKEQERVKIPPNAEYYIVTDSRFGQNSRGGADMLKGLIGFDQLTRFQWKRAVVYSEEPILDDSDRASGVISVKKRGRPSDEANRILDFLDNGGYFELDNIREICGSLRPLLFCCNAFCDAGANVRKTREPLRPMSAYAIPRDDAKERRYWFDAVLLDQGEMISTFTAGTAQYFPDWTKKLFLKYHSNARKDNQNKIDENKWKTVLRSLHPWESLKGMGDTNELPAARLLWEIVRTGGDETHFDEHPAARADELTARERVWVRRQLEGPFSREIKNGAGTVGLISLATRAVHEIQEVEKILRDVGIGESWLEDGAL